MHLIETIGNLTDDVKATVQSRINANYAWLDKNRGPIIQWISKYNIRSGSSTITVSIVTLCLGLALTISRLF